MSQLETELTLNALYLGGGSTNQAELGEMIRNLYSTVVWRYTHVCCEGDGCRAKVESNEPTEAIEVTLIQQLVTDEQLRNFDLELVENHICLIELGVSGPGKGWISGGMSMISTCPKCSHNEEDVLVEGELGEEAEGLRDAWVACLLGL